MDKLLAKKNNIGILMDTDALEVMIGYAHYTPWTYTLEFIVPKVWNR